MNTIVSWADYGENIPLRCKQCGALFATKNITRIGARSVFVYKPLVGKNVELAESCNSKGHASSDLEPCIETYELEKNS